MSCRCFVFCKFPTPKPSTSVIQMEKLSTIHDGETKIRYAQDDFGVSPCTTICSRATSLPGALQTARASLEPRTHFFDFDRLVNTSCEGEGPSTSTSFKENTAQSRIALCFFRLGLWCSPCCFAEMKAFGLITGANGSNIMTWFPPLFSQGAIEA